MNLYLLKILQILISVAVVVSENVTESAETQIIKNDYTEASEIAIPQMGTLQKFQIMGRAYVIPESKNFTEFYENYINFTPTAKTITSKNYPLPYPSGTENFQIYGENSTGLEITIHILDIDPKIDYLKISSVTEFLDHKPKELVLTGLLREPLQLRALNIIEIKLTFYSGKKEGSQTHTGFLITYKPFGEIPPPVTNPPDVTIPFDDLETISRLIVIDEAKQNNVTWSKIKEVLCNATNSFINSNKDITFEPCYPNNITFTKVFKCPKDWPNSLTCIDLNFALTLYSVNNYMTTLDPFLEDANPRIPNGLNLTELNKMWNDYGRSYMKAAGYPEYSVKNPNNDFILFGGIGIGVILISLLILFILLKVSNALKHKWSSLEEEDTEEIKENEIDISMYPSPDQIVPVLFPGSISTSYSNNSYLHYKRNTGASVEGGIRVRNFSESSDTIQEEPNSENEGNINLGFVSNDERMENNCRVQVNGVNKDEAHT